MFMFVPGVCVPVRSPERSKCTDKLPDFCPGVFRFPEPEKPEPERVQAFSVRRLPWPDAPEKGGWRPKLPAAVLSFAGKSYIIEPAKTGAFSDR